MSARVASPLGGLRGRQLLVARVAWVAVAVTALTIILFQRPEQLRILSWRVQRKYDARKMLEAFSSKLRDQTDLRTLSDDLVSKVKETMQPEHVSLWLRPDTSPKDS